MDKPIYLDYNATTPVAPEVLEKMLPWMTDQFWNASSSHSAGRAANAAVDRARRQLADLIGCSPREIVWTSGSTEANNLALKGTMEHAGVPRKLLVAASEHKAILDTAAALEAHGFAVQHVKVTASGLVDLVDLCAKLDEQVALVSVMFANNETGVLQPLPEIAAMVHEAGALFHTDATQAVGKIPVAVGDLGIDLASLSAHKFYGPKGVGALYVRRGVDVAPQLHGGGHEAGVRSGTLNVPGIVGTGAAAALASTVLGNGEMERQRQLVARLVSGLAVAASGATVVSGNAPRLANTVNLRFPGIDAEAVMANAASVCVSSGSACTARIPEPSHVLLSMGMDREAAYECLRFSVGRGTTAAEIDEVVDVVAKAVGRVRHLMNRQQSDMNTRSSA